MIDDLEESQESLSSQGYSLSIIQQQNQEYSTGFLAPSPASLQMKLSAFSAVTKKYIQQTLLMRSPTNVSKEIFSYYENDYEFHPGGK